MRGSKRPEQRQDLYPVEKSVSFTFGKRVYTNATEWYATQWAIIAGTGPPPSIKINTTR